MQTCLGCTPVTPQRDAAALLGISRRGLDRLLADGVLIRLNRSLVVGGCIVERAAEDARLAHRLKLDVLLATYSDCVASHESAALVRSLPVFQLPPYAIGTRQAGAWRGGNEGRVRIAPLPAEHVDRVDGVPCTNLLRTVVDVARSRPMRDAVVVGDAALRRGILVSEVHQVLDEVAEWADVGRAREAIRFFDARAESPLESLSRVIFHEFGLPRPEIQYEITVAGEPYRVDFYWKDERLVGEADGRGKYSSDPNLSPEEVTWREKLREDAIRDAGYKFVRWTYAQLLGQTEATMQRIVRHLAR